jgi:hypothetical protein
MTQPVDPNNSSEFGPRSPFGGEFPISSQQPAGQLMTWQEIFKLVITQPSEHTFWTILSDPQASVQRAIKWLVSAAIISGAILMLSVSIKAAVAPSGTTDDFPILELFMASGFTISVTIGFFFYTSFLHVVAKMLGGKGKLDETIYTFAAFYVPIWLIGSIPLLGAVLILPLFVYELYLTVLGIKSVHQFSWIRAIATVSMLFITLVGILLCWLICVLVSIINYESPYT